MPVDPLASPEFQYTPAQPPRSGRFDDVYYSADSGTAECRHVFLAGNDLPERWHTPSGTPFVVGELGFGTGLNVLATWAQWRRVQRSVPTAPPRLHVISVEGFPLTRDELACATAEWPELAAERDELVAHYPAVPLPGFQRLIFDGGSVCLTLLFGEVVAMLRDLEAVVDAWFFDGFSPEKNPEMWRPEVFAEVARLSRPHHTTFATYTVAASVRQNLQTAGFAAEKAPGFGRKRHMLRGHFLGSESKTSAPNSSSASLREPWFATPRPIAALTTTPTNGSSGVAVADVAVIGGGIAGTSVAAALGRRGVSVSIVERGAELAAGASGNAVGIIMPRLAASATPDARIHDASHEFAWRLIHGYAKAGLPVEFAQCGALQLAVDDDEAQRQEKIVASNSTNPRADGAKTAPLRRVDAREAAEIAQLPSVAYGGVWAERAGWIAPPTIMRALAGNATIVAGRAVARLEWLGDSAGGDGLWRLFDASNVEIARANAVVMANARDARAISQTAWLPLGDVRGQISYLAATPESARLACVITANGYLCPAHQGQHTLGATYEILPDANPGAEVLDAPELTVRAADHTANLTAIRRGVPGLFADADVSRLPGRAGLRSVTRDRLPMVGPVPDHSAVLRDYASLRVGTIPDGPPPTMWPNLYMFVGLGSRGMMTAPLLAELLVCQMLGEPWPLEISAARVLHPLRFTIRDLKRNRA